MKLLIAEDNEKLLKSLVHIFKSNKYIADGVTNGEDALEHALSEEYDGIITDIVMPGIDGVEMVKRLRKMNVTTPVLFLTAKNEVEQRIEGFDAGCDDYIAKPFSNEELLARVRAMLRRKDNYMPEMLVYKGVTLNRSTYEIIYDDKSQPLSGKEFQIMELLMQKAEIITSTEQFMSRIWGWETGVDTSVVWVHIYNLRKKLKMIEAPVEIRFVRNAGYILGGG